MAIKKAAAKAPVKAPKGHERPIRALFGSRNAYRRALADWIKVWARWRSEFKRQKKETRKRLKAELAAA